ncbi:MAG: histidinol-phosphatase HisJ family protein [Chitinivibrionales bacterium]|nr:histidinol-phosphatase HisJ family protein [Chitinivibrionales bacterium]MBD3394544.1 histidinol-phosphatase HisJ family protein [Chitinivibrionales bacterium]
MPAGKPTVADYHVHTPYCGHAQGKIVEYVDAAIAAGIPEIGFSDHLGRYYLTKSQKRRYWDWGMNERNLGRYLSELSDVSETYDGRIGLRAGLEVDFIEGAEDLLTPIMELYPVDYLLASIHCIPSLGWKHIAHYTKRDSWPVYEEYFRLARAAIESGLFDSLAHMDFIWRYVKWPAGKGEEVFKLIDRTVEGAARADVAVEINSNGYLWSQLYKVDEGDPFDALVRSVVEHGAHITIGSDAHKPEFVGKAFDSVVPALKDRGVAKYSVFAERKRREKAIP